MPCTGVNAPSCSLTFFWRIPEVKTCTGEVPVAYKYTVLLLGQMSISHCFLNMRMCFIDPQHEIQDIGIKYIGDTKYMYM